MHTYHLVYMYIHTQVERLNFWMAWKFFLFCNNELCSRLKFDFRTRDNARQRKLRNISVTRGSEGREIARHMFLKRKVSSNKFSFLREITNKSEGKSRFGFTLQNNKSYQTKTQTRSYIAFLFKFWCL